MWVVLVLFKGLFVILCLFLFSRRIYLPATIEETYKKEEKLGICNGVFIIKLFFVVLSLIFLLYLDRIVEDEDLFCVFFLFDSWFFFLSSFDLLLMVFKRFYWPKKEEELKQNQKKITIGFLCSALVLSVGLFFFALWVWLRHEQFIHYRPFSVQPPFFFPSPPPSPPPSFPPLPPLPPYSPRPFSPPPPYSET